MIKAQDTEVRVLGLQLTYRELKYYLKTLLIKLTNMIINAYVINGRHAGFYMRIKHSPTIKLKIKKEAQISLGEAEEGVVRIGDKIEYKECFRAIDGRSVLYSASGESRDFDFVRQFLVPSYPIDFSSHLKATRAKKEQNKQF